MLPLARSELKCARLSLLLRVGVRVVLLKCRNLKITPAKAKSWYISKIQSTKRKPSTTKLFYFLNFHRYQGQAIIKNTCCFGQ